MTEGRENSLLEDYDRYLEHWGLNDPKKQSEVHSLIMRNKLILGIMETRVRSIIKGLRMLGWSFIHNYQFVELEEFGLAIILTSCKSKRNSQLIKSFIYEQAILV